VDVSDGELLISKKLAKLCGSTIPSDILTSGRFLRVDLVTDESNNRKGFSANFYSVSPDGVTSSTFERKHLKTIPPDTDEPGKGGNSSVMIAVVCSLGGVVIIGLIFLFVCIKKKKHPRSNQPNRAQMEMTRPASGASSQRNQQPLPPPPPYSSVVSNAPPRHSSSATVG